MGGAGSVTKKHHRRNEVICTNIEKTHQSLSCSSRDLGPDTFSAGPGKDFSLLKMWTACLHAYQDKASGTVQFLRLFRIEQNVLGMHIYVCRFI